MDRKIIATKEIKEISLKILLEIDDICKTQNIQYFLCSGTLLGAIRHKGFIPWDDDIDISMPRHDYEKFIDYCKENETSFGLIAHETDPNYLGLFAKAYAKNTRIIYRTLQIEQCQYGIWVDIFPVDGLGNTCKQAKKIIRSVYVRRHLLTASQWKKFFRNKWKKWYEEVERFLIYVCGKFVCNPQKLFESINRISKQFKFNDSEFCGAVAGYGKREILKQKIYTELEDVEFEGHYLKGLKNYDEYLTSLYGNYMQLPSKAQQIPHHDFDVYICE